MPHLKELVKLYDDQPFAIIGVNSGDTVDAYKTGIEKYGLTWISAYQHDNNEMLNELFKVQGFPTYFLIDAEGKIASVGHRSKSLDATIKKLVEAVEAN